MIPPALRPLALLLATGAAAGACRPAAAPPAPVPAALEEAERALLEGRFGAARKGLRTLPRAALETREARLRGASAAMKAREPSLAADILSADAEEPARLLRCEALLRSRRFGEARSALDALPKDGPGNERRRVLGVMLGMLEGRRDEARAEAAALVREGTLDPDAHVLHAQELTETPAIVERLLQEALGRVSDRAPVLRALGRLLLYVEGNPRRAAEPLEIAVRERPWDRDARLDLATALRRTGRDGDLARAVTQARSLRAEDPSDAEATLVLAEVLAEGIRSAAAGAGGTGVLRGEAFAEALALYEELAGRPPAEDPARAVRVLQGLARLHVEAILVDDPARATVPGSRFRRAMETLDRAWALDPEGKLRDGAGVRLSAETLFLRGKACKKAHTGDMDHTLAVGWYEKALDPRVGGDPRHLEAHWDLGLLYADFLRTPDYIRKARSQFEDHITERERRGLPPLAPDLLRIVAQVRALAEKGLGLEPGTSLGADPPK